MHNIAAHYESRVAQLEKENAALHRVRNRFLDKPATDGSNSQQGAVQDRSRSTTYAAQKSTFECLDRMSTLQGGATGLTSFLVKLMAGKFRRKHKVLDDACNAILDEPALRKHIVKRIDQDRKPPIRRFRWAKLRTTIAAMDGLRFAMPWCPGHASMLKDKILYLLGIETNWCPSSPDAKAWLTSRTADEQRAAAEEEAARAADVAASASPVADEDADPEEEAAVQAEAEAAVAEAARTEATRTDSSHTLDSGADNFEKEALDLLALEFPAESARKHFERWTKGGDASGLYAGMRVVHVCAVTPARKLLGFVKALVNGREIFVEEVLVAEAARGQHLAAHLLGTLMYSCPKIRFSRLQVSASKEKAPARHVYGKLNYGDTRPRGAPWEEPLDECLMLGATRAAVERGYASVLAAKGGLMAGIAMHVFWGGVGLNDEGEQMDIDDDGGGEEEACGGAGGEMEDEVPLAEERDAGREGAEAEPSCAEAGAGAGEIAGGTHGCDEREMREDDLTNSNSSKAGAKEAAPSWGASSLVNALVMLLVAQWSGNVVLPRRAGKRGWEQERMSARSLRRDEDRSAAQRVGFKITCDAATLVRAAKAFRTCTTVIVQLLAAGVTPGNWSGAVEKMAWMPQSCLRAFPLRTWFAKDDKVNVRSAPPPPQSPVTSHQCRGGEGRGGEGGE
jgi:hypothetical protein